MWGRAAVTIVVALAATCVSVAAAQALSTDTEIAIQSNTGYVWTWTLLGGAVFTGLGMKARTSPSVGPLGFGHYHEIAFQANTGDLWTTGLGGGDTGLGMMAGTSPSISRDTALGGAPLPTSKKQCQHGGWKSFGFENQRDCMRFVKLFHQPHEHHPGSG
ncbi:MAG: hypothetical protein JO181_17745 [Solirubrobacterales bacterium]|nr:hypothetical protein [Solirubrobacterales bacterium]